MISAKSYNYAYRCAYQKRTYFQVCNIMFCTGHLAYNQTLVAKESTCAIVVIIHWTHLHIPAPNQHSFRPAVYAYASSRGRRFINRSIMKCAIHVS